MKLKRNIPNLITLINLFIGCLSILLAFYDITWAAYLIFISVVLDFLDGALAKWLNARSEFGRELDSLADLVSFGIAPAFIMYILLIKSDYLPEFKIDMIYILPLVSFLIPVFSAVRLARFNIHEKAETRFRGLPAPANAIMIASFPLILNQYSDGPQWVLFIFQNAYVLTGMILLLCFLMISRISLISFKYESLSWKAFKYQYILLALSVILFIVLGFAAIPCIIFLYIILSLAGSGLSKNKE